MKITTRNASWGIELKTDVVSEDIHNSSQQELQETILNFLEVSTDLLRKIKDNDTVVDDLVSILEYIVNEVEEII